MMVMDIMLVMVMMVMMVVMMVMNSPFFWLNPYSFISELRKVVEAVDKV